MLTFYLIVLQSLVNDQPLGKVIVHLLENLMSLTLNACYLNRLSRPRPPLVQTDLQPSLHGHICLSSRLHPLPKGRIARLH
jgi:hypothetical protein